MQKMTSKKDAISYSKLYSKHRLIKSLSLTNKEATNLLNDIQPIKQGEQLLYNGLDILLKIQPDNEKLKRLQKNIGICEGQHIKIKVI